MRTVWWWKQKKKVLHGALYICKHDSPLCDMPRSLTRKLAAKVRWKLISGANVLKTGWGLRTRSHVEVTLSLRSREKSSVDVASSCLGIVVVLKERSMFELKTAHCLRLSRKCLYTNKGGDWGGVETYFVTAASMQVCKQQILVFLPLALGTNWRSVLPTM